VLLLLLLVLVLLLLLLLLLQLLHMPALPWSPPPTDPLSTCHASPRHGILECCRSQGHNVRSAWQVVAYAAVTYWSL
jgi:hypothetical protein